MFFDQKRKRSDESYKAFPLCATAAGVLLGLAIGAGSANAEPNNHVLRQITNLTTGEIETPKIRSQDGDSVSFISNGDVLGTGTQTSQRHLYYWDEATDTITQVTSGENCEAIEQSRPMDTTFSGGRPQIIAFISNCDLDPDASRSNSDGNYELFFWAVETGTFYQITDTVAPVVNATPFVSDSGRCIVFSSTGDLDNNVASNPNYDDKHPGPGFSNLDGSEEVFLLSTLSAEQDRPAPFPYNGTFTQLSNGPAGTKSENPVIGGYWYARQCQTTVWQSDHDQLGTGAQGTQLWIYHKPASEVRPFDYPGEMNPIGLSGVFPAGNYTRPFISAASPFARGPHVAFEAQTDLWANGSEGEENVYNMRIFHPRLTQFTDTQLYSPGAQVRRPSVSDGGGVFSYHSTGEFVSQKRSARIGGSPPFNSDGNNEIFRIKGRSRIFQLTKTENCDNSDASLDDSGRRFAWRSTCDLVPGANPSGAEQVFVWSLEKNNSENLANCEQANGCCSYSRKDPSSCYQPVFGSKPKPPRPNCEARSTPTKDRCTRTQ